MGLVLSVWAFCYRVVSARRVETDEYDVEDGMPLITAGQ